MVDRTAMVRKMQVRILLRETNSVVFFHRHLEQPAPQAPTSERQLREIRKALNDAHKHITAVSKALKKNAA